jgi:hypothetical protein
MFDVITQTRDVSVMTGHVFRIRLKTPVFGLQLCMLGEERVVLCFEIAFVGHLQTA